MSMASSTDINIIIPSDQNEQALDFSPSVVKIMYKNYNNMNGKTFSHIFLHFYFSCITLFYSKGIHWKKTKTCIIFWFIF